MSRKQKDLEYVGTDKVHAKGFVIRVKNEEAVELVDTGKWKRIPQVTEDYLKRQGELY